MALLVPLPSQSANTSDSSAEPGTGMEPVVLYGSAVAVTLVVLLVVTLLFSRKTPSFEEAVLQQRRQQNSAVAVKPKKMDSRKEKKSD